MTNADEALDEAEKTGTPSLLSAERGQLFDAEKTAYEALVDAQIAALNADEEA